MNTQTINGEWIKAIAFDGKMKFTESIKTESTRIKEKDPKNDKRTRW